MAIADTRVSDHRPDPEKVVGYAALMLLTLRENAVPDSEIVARHTTAVPEADTAFEDSQRAKFGCVLAPAAMVKRELLAMVRERVAA